MKHRATGFTLIELLIVVAIIAILAVIAVPNFLEAQTRAKLARVKADQRVLVTAMEAFRLDNNSYPLYCNNYVDMRNANYFAKNAMVGNYTDQAYSFRVRLNPTDKFATLTTPIAYITSYPTDPFARTKGLCFCYTKTDPEVGDSKNHWMIWSFGPDQDERDDQVVLASAIAYGQTFKPPYDPRLKNNPKPGDILIYSPTRTSGYIDRTMYCPTRAYPSPALLDVTYDPTNGTISNGDVYVTRP